MTKNAAAHEAAIIESMHTGDYSAPDLEYTPITEPLPRLVRREVEELRQKEGREAAAEAEIDKLRAALAAERVRVAELEAHLAARQRRAELDAGGIGAVCPACGYELDEHGWCGMCTPEAVQP